MGFSLKNFRELVKVGMQYMASDIHIRTDETPCFRIRGDLVPVQTKTFTLDDVYDICRILLSDASVEHDVERINEMDGSFTVQEVARVRYNIFRYQGMMGITLRIVKTQIPTIGELNLPPINKDIAMANRGLVLVTGATGSGKSTTLAAMINHINQHRMCHIITIEDPIEYTHTQNKSRITQREIGKDTTDFSAALRASLRQDPDIILIGEMRDVETINIALKAAETGHLVFSTLHTTNAVATLNRIISMFTPEEQQEARKRLAHSLYATMGQRMIKGKKAGKLFVAQEIMINGPGIRNSILGDEPMEQIYTYITKGKGKGGNGSQSFDQHVLDLYNSGLISKEDALEAATSKSDFLQKLLVE